MQLDAMFLQLGIAGAMLLVMYRIAMKWMANEAARQAAAAKVESERTSALADAEAAKAEAIQAGFRADIEAHQSMVSMTQKLVSQFARIEGKFDMILDLTPVREMHASVIPQGRVPGEPKVIVSDDLPVEPPVARALTPRNLSGVISDRKTPRGGTPIVGGEYAYTPNKPPKK